MWLLMAALAAVVLIAYTLSHSAPTPRSGTRPPVTTLRPARKERRRDGVPDGYYPGWWGDMLREHEYRCFYCGIHAERGQMWLQKEHLIPIARGGAHAVTNIRPACPHCNLVKGTLTEEEFRELIRHNDGVVPRTRRAPATSSRPPTNRDMIHAALRRLAASQGVTPGWTVKEILTEVLAQNPAANAASLRATLSTMGTTGALERVERGRYRPLS